MLLFSILRDATAYFCSPAIVSRARCALRCSRAVYSSRYYRAHADIYFMPVQTNNFPNKNNTPSDKCRDCPDESADLFPYEYFN